MSEPTSKPHKDRSALLVLLGITAIAFLVRVPDLGRQSPWLDEIANWLIASKYSLEGQHVHFVSYALIRAGLQISDSTFGLRLYSALFGMLSVIIATAWALQRRGRTEAILLGGALALSPFHIFYSQDANHYAVILLLGTIGAVGIDWYLERRRVNWLGMVTLIGTALLAVGSHPFGAVAAASAGLVAYVWLMINTDRLPPRGRGELFWRTVLILMFVIGGAFAIPRAWDKLLASSGGQHAHARNFGLNWEFWRAMLGDLYGGMFHHNWPDTLLGITGALLSLTGLGILAKRRPWAAVGSASMIVFTILPFALVSYSHYFAPRYFAALVPALAIGASAAIGAAIRCARRRPDWQRRAVGVAMIFWMALFLVRFGVWEVDRLRNDHQPSMQALEWFRDETPSDAILLTRHRYSSRAVEFLWDRMDMGDRQHVSLSYIYRFPVPSIQQAEEQVAAAPGRVYFTSLIEAEDRLSSEFNWWIENRTEVVADFPSGSPDEFVPIDWSVRVRRVLPAEIDHLALPKSGAQASVLTGEERLTAGRGNLLVPGTGASYRFRLDKPAPGLVMQAVVAAEGKDPLHLIAGIDGGPHAMVTGTPEQNASVVRYVLRAPLEAGEGRLDLAVAANSPSVPGGALIMEIDAWDGKAGELLHPLEPIGAVNTGPPAEFVNPGEGPLMEVMRRAPAGAQIVAVQRFRLDGLGDRALVASVQSGDTRVRLIPRMQWTNDVGMTAAVLESDGNLSATYRILSRSGFRPYKPNVMIEPLELYQVPSE
ncbi:hypothetical protein KQI84_11495 [bacterium]|nr:hypothetical protein [bacterium]